jgi:lipoprotein-anchoring transpeptidase ErfK/SrfK
MRYLVALALVILGTTFGVLGYRAWTAGPPVSLPAPKLLGVTAGGLPLLPGGWTSSPSLDLRMNDRAAAATDVEVQPAGTSFSDNPTVTVKTPASCAGAGCALIQVHLTDGQYHVHFRLHSDQGVSPWVSFGRMIRVDTVPPVKPRISSSTDPNPTQVYHHSTMQFAWQSSDTGSGIAGYSYRFDTDANGIPRPEIRTSSPSVKLVGLNTGSYYFHVRARDVAGNWSPTATFPVTIDVTPPGLAHVQFSAYTFDPLYVGLTVSFAVTKAAPSVHVGVYRQTDHSLVRLYKLQGLTTGRQASVTWDGKDSAGQYAPAGSYQIYIRATDAYGHSTLSGWSDLAVSYQRIVVSLSQQKLWAYNGNSIFLTSLVTTGNRALPTPTGEFMILGKFHPFTFRSPWPKSSPFWYPPSLTQWAMLFKVGGYFIHDAPWRSVFGPGSNSQVGTPGNNYTGTHGCINVPNDVAQKLFAWAPIGTAVIVKA